MFHRRMGGVTDSLHISQIKEWKKTLNKQNMTEGCCFKMLKVQLKFK